MESMIDKIMNAAVHLQECRLFMKSPNGECRKYGEDCAVEYIEVLREELDAFVYETEKEAALE